jgi:hypothetical protein
MITRGTLAGLVVAAMTLGSMGAGAVTATEKCESDKVKTAGKYAFCRMKADSKAIKKNVAPDYTKCVAKYALIWAKVEGNAGGACPVTGDEAAIDAQTTECADGLTAAIGGNPPVGCVADLVECEDDLTTCDTELTTCGDNLTTCEDDLAVAELCGNGALDGGEDCDLGTLAGETCVTQGFTGGVLSCANGCTFDTSGCWNMRFVDNGDGTITDNASGLMWEKKTELNSTTNFANPHDPDNLHQWAGSCSINTGKRCQPNAGAAAACAAGVEGNPLGCEECTGGDGVCNVSTGSTIWHWVAQLNAGSFAGHGDWRVATLDELQAIVDYADTTSPVVDVAFHGASCGAACTDITDPACSCTLSNYSWSASTYAPFPTIAWAVTFNDGNMSFFSKTDSGPVRAVRPGS